MMKLLHKNWNKYYGIYLLLGAFICYILCILSWGAFGRLEGPTTTGDRVADLFLFLAGGLAIAGFFAVILAILAGKSQRINRVQYIFMAVFGVVSLYGIALYFHTQARQHQTDKCYQAAGQNEANESVAAYESQTWACDQLDKKTFIL